MICKWVYIIGNTGSHCPIHFNSSDTKDAWLLSVEPDLLAPWRPTSSSFFYIPTAELVALATGMSSGWPARWSLVLVHLLVLEMTAGPKPRLCVSLISVSLFGWFSFLQVYGVVEVLFYEVSVCILFPSCDSRSINIVCPRKLNWGQQYCQFVFKLCEVGAIQNCSTFRVLPRTR